MSYIENIVSREILDSRGWPTIETTVELISGTQGTASVPSGASTGSFEACELRDGGSRFLGKGVLTAVGNVENIILPEIDHINVFKQRVIDQTLIEIDGTPNKKKLGANATLSVSLAVCRAAAQEKKIPLYQYIGGLFGSAMPKPMMNILNGGKHADNKVDVQEFMIVPRKTATFKEYVLMCSVIYHNLKNIAKSKGLNVNAGDEGGIAPDLGSTREALDLILEAIKISDYSITDDVAIALDVAASELYYDGAYHIEGQTLPSDQMISYYKTLINEYPIISIEDGLAENDWEGWASFTKECGKDIMIIGDDLFVTNQIRLKQGIEQKAANSILIKPNQIGTLSETLDTIRLAQGNSFNTVISHRSGETEDTFIADLAVGVRAPYIKTGAPARGERVAKYNRLLRIEEELLRNNPI